MNSLTDSAASNRLSCIVNSGPVPASPTRLTSPPCGIAEQLAPDIVVHLQHSQGPVEQRSACRGAPEPTTHRRGLGRHTVVPIGQPQRLTGGTTGTTVQIHTVRVIHAAAFLWPATRVDRRRQRLDHLPLHTRGVRAATGSSASPVSSGPGSERGSCLSRWYRRSTGSPQRRPAPGRQWPRVNAMGDTLERFRARRPGRRRRPSRPGTAPPASRRGCRRWRPRRRCPSRTRRSGGRQRREDEAGAASRRGSSARAR